ncbi:Membrane transport protein [Corynebacterium occultum]|uniref:Membrane transport protein n=1 Tax=Corynebacterium occultum TaxID=2675219 RepID=A0A6B8VQH3_9CORY|nr:AEC family transporter [Corynebacterium occultum]QGU06373.1 Membrane transport protein [Corynebacterium occultum]
MLGIITGFAIILSIIFIGFLLSAKGIIQGEKQRLVLNRVAFYAATPALLFNVVATSDPAELFSPVIGVIFLATALTALLFCVISVIFFKRDIPTTAMGASAAAYVNSNNIGLPVSIYVLGTGAYVAPVLVLQLVVFTPLMLAALSVSGGASGLSDDGKRHSSRRKILHVIKNSLFSPIVLGSVAGLVVCLMQWEVPAPVMAPFEILGGASIPMILLSFGASLTTTRVLNSTADRASVLTATTIKLVGMPLIALGLGLALRLDTDALYAAVILAALPTAQNVYNYAATYRKGEVVARDSVFLTTFAALPAMLVIALLFGR